MATQSDGSIEILRENPSSQSPPRSQSVTDHYQENYSVEIGEYSLRSVIAGNKKLRLALRTVIGMILFLALLGCVTASKLTLILLTNKLRHVTVNRTKEEVRFLLNNYRV